MLKQFIMVLAACVMATIAPLASAYEFAPIVAQFSPNGSGAARTFVVRNTHDVPVALQIEVYRRSADATGEETREPEYDDFIITPPQLVLAPGQSQSIRAQWIGDPNPEIELSYRLIVEQLPIPYSREEVGDKRVADISMGIRYEAALYVVPANGKPSVKITRAEAAKSESGEQVLRITIKNTGQRRAILQNPELKLQSGDQTFTMSGESVSNINNRNIIAGTQAVIDVPWPAPLPVGPVSASISTDFYQN
ncbi:MAG: molecular chaperone [Alphaproteobacteria bacterium]|nr:molecular chaperone [Alphaproteobacteria bacterium]|tara:strand:- start:7811 stop:8563 length:753 start_codon:yes stop_codon:yes gene_type:complete